MSIAVLRNHHRVRLDRANKIKKATIRATIKKMNKRIRAKMISKQGMKQ